MKSKNSVMTWVNFFLFSATACVIALGTYLFIKAPPDGTKIFIAVGFSVVVLLMLYDPIRHFWKMRLRNLKARNFSHFIRLAKKHGCTEAHVEAKIEKLKIGKFNFCAELNNYVHITYSEDIDLGVLFEKGPRKYTPNEKITKYAWEKMEEVKKNIKDIRFYFYVQRGLCTYESNSKDEYERYMQAGERS